MKTALRVLKSSSDNAAPEMLENLVRQAGTAGASDIHLQMLANGAEVCFRLDGVMTPMTRLGEEVADRVFGRIKFLARLKTYQDSLPQDGRIDKGHLSALTDIRVSTYPTITGEKIVLRLFQNTSAKTWGNLDFPNEAAAELEKCLAQPSGLLLLTGPAGSGKTTTIYACLSRLATTGGRHIITVEDPVEQIIPGIMQTEVNEALGLNFARAARHLLRQDPQALVIGEIRDDETAQIAVRAALTGHLVISTLHAGSCQGVFERLLVLCPDRSAIASAVELVLNQRLMRVLCRDCAGAGCAVCLHTGYKGRLPLVEWLRVNDALRAQIRLRELQGVAPQRTLEEFARELLQRGLSNETEYRRVFGK